MAVRVGPRARAPARAGARARPTPNYISVDQLVTAAHAHRTAFTKWLALFPLPELLAISLSCLSFWELNSGTRCSSQPQTRHMMTCWRPETDHRHTSATRVGQGVRHNIVHAHAHVHVHVHAHVHVQHVHVPVRHGELGVLRGTSAARRRFSDAMRPSSGRWVCYVVQRQLLTHARVILLA